LLPLAAEFAEAIATEKSFFVEEKIIEAREIAASTELGPSGQAIVNAAEKRGIPWERQNEYSLVQLGYGKNLHLVQAAMSDQTSAIVVEFAGDKDFNRNDALIQQSGRVAAAGFQRVIIKEDVDTRGRKRGEVAQLLCETVTKESPERECSIVIDEISAFENELKNLTETSVVVIFYDKLTPVLNLLAKYDAIPVTGIEQDLATIATA
jgi:cyanophycin synthetase